MIKDGKLSHWEEGMVSHALGDAFAHVKYPNGIETAYGSPVGHATAGNAPDLISNNVSNYTDYVNAVFDSLGGNRMNPAQTAALNLILAAAGGLQKYPIGDFDVDGSENAKEAATMAKLAQTPPFGYSGAYKPSGPLSKTFVTPNHNQVADLIAKIKTACKCK